jgi:hypothetical protein
MQPDLTRELFFAEHRHLDTPANDNRELGWKFYLFALLGMWALGVTAIWAACHIANLVLEWMGK